MATHAIIKRDFSDLGACVATHLPRFSLDLVVHICQYLVHPALFSSPQKKPQLRKFSLPDNVQVLGVSPAGTAVLSVHGVNAENEVLFCDYASVWNWPTLTSVRHTSVWNGTGVGFKAPLVYIGTKDGFIHVMNEETGKSTKPIIKTEMKRPILGRIGCMNTPGQFLVRAYNNSAFVILKEFVILPCKGERQKTPYMVEYSSGGVHPKTQNICLIGEYCGRWTIFYKQAASNTWKRGGTEHNFQDQTADTHRVVPTRDSLWFMAITTTDTDVRLELLDGSQKFVCGGKYEHLRSGDGAIYHCLEWWIVDDNCIIGCFENNLVVIAHEW